MKNLQIRLGKEILNVTQKDMDQNSSGMFIQIIMNNTDINCDKIMILENGKITDQGNHEELLNRNNTYKTLYQTEILK